MHTAERKQRVQVVSNMTYESSVGLENIIANNTTTIFPFGLPEIDIIKDIESCTAFFFTWRLLVLLGDSEIIQVSVVDCDRLRRFDQYLYPNGSIIFGTTRVIGRVALAGHNVRAIDVRRFWNNVKKWHLEYLSCVLALKVLLIHFH